MAVVGDGVTTDDHELGFHVGQRDEQVAEVVVEFDHDAARSMNRTGISPRV